MKKRTLALLCAAVLLVLSALPAVSLAATRHYYVYTKNGKSLNMRSDMTTHADNVITQIPFGKEVTVHSFYDSDTWANVSYNGYYGYVLTRYLVTSKPSKPAASTTSELNFKSFKTASYSASVRPSAPGGYVNMRWAPSKKVDIRERVYEGTVLEVIAENATWAQVRNPADNTVGFMMRTFLTPLAGG